MSFCNFDYVFDIAVEAVVGRLPLAGRCCY